MPLLVNYLIFYFLERALNARQKTAPIVHTLRTLVEERGTFQGCIVAASFRYTLWYYLLLTFPQRDTTRVLGPGGWESARTLVAYVCVATVPLEMSTTGGCVYGIN